MKTIRIEITHSAYTYSRFESKLLNEMLQMLGELANTEGVKVTRFQVVTPRKKS